MSTAQNIVTRQAAAADGNQGKKEVPNSACNNAKGTANTEIDRAMLGSSDAESAPPQNLKNMFLPPKPPTHAANNNIERSNDDAITTPPSGKPMHCSSGYPSTIIPSSNNNNVTTGTTNRPPPPPMHSSAPSMVFPSKHRFFTVGRLPLTRKA